LVSAGKFECVADVDVNMLEAWVLLFPVVWAYFGIIGIKEPLSIGFVCPDKGAVSVSKDVGVIRRGLVFPNGRGVFKWELRFVVSGGSSVLYHGHPLVVGEGFFGGGLTG
jgi:hypothetical protein